MAATGRDGPSKQQANYLIYNNIELPTMNFLEVKDVAKQYGSHTALNHVSMSVDQGTIYGLLGPNGAGKTTLINNLYDFFKKAGFVVEILEEFTTSKKYKKEIWPTLKDKYKSVVNTEIPKHVLRQLEDALKKKPEIIIVDRSLFDRTIWIDRLYLKSGITEEEYKNYFDIYTPLIKEKINIVISTYTDSITSLKRDYEANLSLEKRNFLNEDNINEYNTSLINMEKYANSCGINFYKFDTTGRSQREISIDVANTILSDMKKFYIEQMNKFFK